MGKEKSHSGDIKSAFRDMLENYKLESKYTAVIIKNSWEKLMGKTIAKRTGKIMLRNRKLQVKINSAPLKNELNMSKTRIIQLLEEELGKGVVEEIIFI